MHKSTWGNRRRNRSIAGAGSGAPPQVIRSSAGSRHLCLVIPSTTGGEAVMSMTAQRSAASTSPRIPARATASVTTTVVAPSATPCSTNKNPMEWNIGAPSSVLTSRALARSAWNPATMAMKLR
ncbi:Os07g0280600 [Oryza sativa Japonica Group]|uniref:Os07g0280600 protein n=1 Tax=Oryza sativa subsp. japonica TaxID=39947 RepID=A0A0P0X4T4_ORYSJ|nr:Os07g0280600 [Oryza sativa Japonica Group]